jgi:hypothetical protein
MLKYYPMNNPSIIFLNYNFISKPIERYRQSGFIQRAGLVAVRKY